jgi:CubicO group peptidase (beta-lactamase class C family)
MKRSAIPAFILFFTVVPNALRAAEGISQQVLDEAAAELKKQVESKSIAGGAHLVVRDGKVVQFQVIGVSDIEDQTPLKADTIMRIYSMTKPITSVAAMTLWEQGKFKLDDPVSKYIPSFEKTNVLVEQDGAYNLVPAERPITVRDVFRHTTGYTYGRGTAPEFFQHYEKEGVLYDPVHEMFPPKMTIAKAADGLARIPALHQPGAKFTYGFNTDLLGRLIEVWSGQPLDEYMHQAVFEPLKMVDTGFAVSSAKKDRFASCHAWKGDKQIIADKANESPFIDGFEFLSGGGGLVSTMQDYANFCQMLVDGGAYQDKRVLKESTIKRMFTSQLEEAAGGFQFGLGFAIRDVTLAAGQRKATAYYWGGYANTAFQVVPEEKLFQVFMRQTIPSTHRVANKLFAMVNEGVQ